MTRALPALALALALALAPHVCLAGSVTTEEVVEVTCYDCNGFSFYMARDQLLIPALLALLLLGAAVSN